VSSSSKRDNTANGVEILVRGTVQGVGFRPFVFKLASRFHITGTVTNTSDGVVIQAAGPQLAAFIDAISGEAPPLARIEDLSWRNLDEPLADSSFTIVKSRASASARANIPPDISLCRDCRDELNDPADRRYRYPFINCTNCGPRFSIVETIPYDRPLTSMKRFAMCPACEAEYRDPANRRFHAQPNACPECGPSISWHDRKGTVVACADIIDAAIAAINADAVVAIRGLGGFHLCVNGCSETAVARLRERKRRPHKPLAVMVANLEDAGRCCHLGDAENLRLESPEHPIVLAAARPGSPLAANIAPGIGDVGIMLPYTPLHTLLFCHPRCPAALVMTSGNHSGEPICTGNGDALKRLEPIADYFLLHNRDIVTRVDDSVVRYQAGAVRSLRRARGYAPAPIRISRQLPELISCGGGLKSTFSLARGRSIYPSQHIGDLFNTASFEFYCESIDNFKRLYEIDPVAAACDLHPDYLSSRYAQELGLPLYPVQHHHAHAAAVMAEHDLSGPVLAVVLDGTGYGPDRTIWGGEILQADLHAFSRLAHLQQVPLPGGDAAAREPWRMATSFLHRIFGVDAVHQDLLPSIDRNRMRLIIDMLESDFNAPLTSSCGRLFDAVASLLDLNHVCTYEGQAAMQLESCARSALTAGWKDAVIDRYGESERYLTQIDDQRWEINSAKFVKSLIDEISAGTNRAALALQFHCWLISCITRLVEKLSGVTGIRDIVLSGGSMQNGILLEGLLFSLTERGLAPFTGSQIPVNDGGISVGQALIGGVQHVSCSTHES
jgi:hydrogenase maturation protein HypF